MKPQDLCVLLGCGLAISLVVACGGDSATMARGTPTLRSEEAVAPSPADGALATGSAKETATPVTAAKATTTPEQTAAAAVSTPVLNDVVTPARSAIQELALLENYAATSFFPDTIIVLRGVPVTLYFSRLHREHVNRFSIEPFFSTSDVVLPGEVAVFEFLPEEAGTFQIRNEGHGFESTLIVVEDAAGAAARRASLGVQEFALIYPADGSEIFPGQIIVEKDVPVTIFNLALDGQHQIAVRPFYSPVAVNVDPTEIASFEFTPDRSGTFAIVDELTNLEVTLIVR